ncbi:MAG: sigma-70 family RNA polymerase sigma factor [Candidatus Diapherotrites archaeon]|nr:sigma-70 family RNA polymerase sigma factor [Candidatus Diapherotrites archaeon]
MKRSLNLPGKKPKPIPPELEKRRAATGAPAAYLRRVHQTKFIQQKKVAMLVERAKKGDKNAMQEICNSHLRLVVSIASRFEQTHATKNLDLPYLTSIGEGALKLAVKKFDPAKAKKTGAKFSTYAAKTIERQILREYQNKEKTIRIPVCMQNLQNKIKRTENALIALGKNPTVEEIAKSAGLNIKQVKRGLESKISIVSIDAPLKGYDTLAFGDTLADRKNLRKELERRDLISEVLKGLKKLNIKDRDKEIWIAKKGFNGNPSTVTEIAKRYGITRQKAATIDKAVNKKMQRVLKRL